jgi:uncharacterized protein YfkK (UPF0435 family)
MNIEDKFQEIRKKLNVGVINKKKMNNEKWNCPMPRME